MLPPPLLDSKLDLMKFETQNRWCC